MAEEHGHRCWGLPALPMGPWDLVPIAFSLVFNLLFAAVKISENQAGAKGVSGERNNLLLCSVQRRRVIYSLCSHPQRTAAWDRLPPLLLCV